jgi:hypothetical protein
MSDDLLGPQEREKDQLRRTIAVHNERAKLAANALDRASTAVLSAGMFGPIANSLYGLGTPLPWEWLIAWFFIWVGVAVALHLAARHILGGLT